MSRVSACLISMLLIVYGSFRSLNMEREARERAEKEREASLLGGKPAPPCAVSGKLFYQTSNGLQLQTLVLCSYILFFFYTLIIISNYCQIL